MWPGLAIYGWLLLLMLLLVVSRAVPASDEDRKNLLRSNPFELTCGLSPFLFSSGQDADSSYRWAQLYLLKHQPLFQLRYGGNGRLLLSRESEAIDFDIDGINPEINGKSLIQFKPYLHAKVGNIYVRFPLDESFDMQIIDVEHGMFEPDYFGGQAYRVARYSCARTALVDGFDSESGLSKCEHLGAEHFSCSE